MDTTFSNIQTMTSEKKIIPQKVKLQLFKPSIKMLSSIDLESLAER